MRKLSRSKRNVKLMQNRSGKIVVAEVRGQIDSRCRLSGIPDLLMTLSSSDSLQDCCFHPCVRLNKWTNSKQLSFVPPDGRFVLMEYQLAAPTIPSSIPILVKPLVTVGKQGGAFHLTISSRNVSSRPLENVKVTFDLGKNASQVQATTSGGRSIQVGSAKEDHEQPGGRWEFIPGEGKLVWQAQKMSSADRPVVFQGTWISS
jgi:AP-3 complex subunit mu